METATQAGKGAGEGRTVVVTGATGRQGGAVTRRLLGDGWRVRALTRNPSSQKARALQTLGAEVVRGDMADLASLQPVLQGAYGVFSVQNSAISGAEGERRQGKTVADAAGQAGVQHVVYASAGPGVPDTGVLQWDIKLDVEAHLRRSGLPLTVLRPMALMELMTDPAFYPAASTWHVMPRLAGSGTPIPWIGAADIGAVAAIVFAHPERFIGQELRLASDVKSLDECAVLYRTVMGKAPPHFPMPVWLLERFAGADVTRMWRWLRTGSVHADPAQTHALLPQALGVEAWLRQYREQREARPAARHADRPMAAPRTAGDGP
jgi:uncharacterized protein YbjT (DUF2867 family)